MIDNPYSSPTAGADSPTSCLKALANMMLAILKFVGSYLLGIFICVSFTEVEFSLAGVNLLPSYVFWSVIGFGLWFFLAFQELPSSPFELFEKFEIVWVLIVCLIPCVGEAVVLFGRHPRFRFWRPMWFGFPIGFVGTLGIYWAAMASI